MENYKLIKLNQDGSLDCWREEEPTRQYHERVKKTYWHSEPIGIFEIRYSNWLESKETFPCASKIDLSEIESCFKVWEEYPINVTDLVEICEGKGYFKEKSEESLEDLTLIDDLFSLWEDLSLAGEISIGIGFSKKYIDMKERMQKFKRK